MTLEITVRDIETGEVEVATIDNDYLMITAGDCYVDGIQAHANGTHVLTVKGRKTL